MALIKNLLRPVYHGGLRTMSLLCRAALGTIGAVIGKPRLLRAVHFVTRELDTRIMVDGIWFDAADSIPLQRGLTLRSKEPDTINWLDDYVARGDVFYDIGANVGVYSLYAAVKRNATVLAFEPMCSNYDVLNRNIFLNGLDGRVSAFNIALHDRMMISHLHLSDFVAGKAGHGFEHKTDSQDNPTGAVFRQGMIGIDLDTFVARFHAPVPNHIKIDVDGNEPLIVEGMRETLRDPRLKSVAVEIDPDGQTGDRTAMEQILAAGFRQLDEERYINRLYAHYTNVRNYFFVRDDPASNA